MNTHLPSNVVFFGGIAAMALALIAAIVFGAPKFRDPIGKLIVIAACLLLATLIGVVLLVLLLSDSARDGAPL